VEERFYRINRDLAAQVDKDSGKKSGKPGKDSLGHLEEHGRR
jgi:hypothetical protein